MSESEMGQRGGTRRVVATNVGRDRQVAHYVTGERGPYVYTACRKAMTQVAPYGGNGVPLCAACVKATESTDG